MCMCIDIRVNPQSNRSDSFLRCRNFCYHGKLFDRLDVETPYLCIKRIFNFIVALTHTGKKYFIGRKAGINSSSYFTCTYTVCSHAGRSNRCKNRRICVCLNCIMHMEGSGRSRKF